MEVIKCHTVSASVRFVIRMRHISTRWEITLLERNEERDRENVNDNYCQDVRPHDSVTDNEAIT